MVWLNSWFKGKYDRMTYEYKAKIKTLTLQHEASIFYEDYDGNCKWLHMPVEAWKEIGSPLVDDAIIISIRRLQGTARNEK